MVTPGLRRRMACWLYETILLFGVGFAAMLLFAVLGAALHTAMNGLSMVVALFVIFGVYCVWFWSKGETLAMRTWHIRIVDTHSQPITQERALLRYGLSFLWILPPLLIHGLLSLNWGELALICTGWIAFWAWSSRLHPNQQFWHDAWAGTRLVQVMPSKQAAA